MAIVGTPDDEDENPTTSSSPNAHAATNAATGAPYTGASGGGSGFVGGTGSGSGQGATTSAPAASPTAAGGASSPGGGSYANLSQYLAANQDTGATTGQAAESLVAGSGQAAQAAQNTFGTDAAGQIAAATSAVKPSSSTLASITGGTQNVDPATLAKISSGAYTYSPNSLALNNLSGASTADLNAIVAAGKAAPAAASSYTGPTNFAGYGGPASVPTVSYGGPTTTSNFTGQAAADQTAALGAQSTVAQNVASAQGGQAGVGGLLQSAYGQPNYTAGENNLDAFLAGGSAGGQAALGQAAGVGQGVNTSYQDLLNSLSGQETAGENTANATNTAYGNAIKAAQGTSTATKNAYQTAEAKAQAAGLAASNQARSDAAKAQAQLTADASKKVGTGGTGGGSSGGQGQQIVNETTGALHGQQGGVNALATDVMTGGLSALAPKQVATETTKLQNEVSPAAQRLSPVGNVVNKDVAAVQSAVAPAVNKVQSAVAPTLRKITTYNPVQSLTKGKVFAHGGEIPSYAGLTRMLKERGKK